MQQVVLSYLVFANWKEAKKAKSPFCFLPVAGIVSKYYEKEKTLKNEG